MKITVYFTSVNINCKLKLFSLIGLPLNVIGCDTEAVQHANMYSY